MFSASQETKIPGHDAHEQEMVMLNVLPDFMPAVDAPVILPGKGQPFVTGVLKTPIGAVPVIKADLLRVDYWGSFKARWGVGRMHYAVDPGLYALGNPDAKSPVFVSANYKMSFDHLRRSLRGSDGWILVLDTLGINVWCAAGKGTFGTAELVRRIFLSGLDRVVSHRRLILPQLSGPGVAAHRVHQYSGFKVIYGPIRAGDLPVFLDNGLKATPDMKLSTFRWAERAVLIPIELVEALRAAALSVPLFAVMGGLLGQGPFLESALQTGMTATSALLTAVISGAVLTPLLLPFVPGRAFSLKGFIIGCPLSLLYLMAVDFPSRLPAVAWFMIMTSLSAFLAMNFTGASTYTSLSGVRKEMRWSLPLEIAGGSLGLLLWLAAFWIH
jgi:acetyl-CoA decarbonylase/synthase complex subunit gamma